MKWLGLLALFAYTFGALTYGSILVLWLREMGRLGWGARFRRGAGPSSADRVNGALLVIASVWFCANIADVLLQLGGRRALWLEVPIVLLAFAFPPIIMHLAWSEARSEHEVPASWGRLLAPAYLACTVLPPVGLALAIRPIVPRLQRLSEDVLTVALSAAFVGAALYSALLVRRFTIVRTARDRAAHRWLLRLFGVMGALFVVMLWLDLTGGSDTSMAAYASRLVEIVAKSLPLVFMFVGTYYENRFHFFDVLVKRGAALLLALATLTLWFALVLPPLRRGLGDEWAAPWLYAVAMLPLLALWPWISSSLAAFLDRRWLGRRFTTVDAIKHFLSGLRSATSESRLVDAARRGLEDIFGAPAFVLVGDAEAAADFDIAHRIEVRTGGQVAGAFLMGPRATDAPYFAADLALLSSLAEVFGSMLENLKLQQRRLEQEQRTRELSLHASRSELKALRAQINPHFLFNALNAIAGLIHRDPAVADRTVEQLAEVFRYALRGSRSEWAALDDEVEFVRAYLEVERARFGDRLQVEIAVDDGARRARVPTMIVQTLVENAVKHGAATVRGRAVVAVRAEARDGRLLLAVSDNGAGFSAAAPPSPSGGGYGLANVRQRLEGYFGADAALRIQRDDAAGVTVASVTLPLLRDEPQPQHATEGTR